MSILYRRLAGFVLLIIINSSCEEVEKPSKTYPYVFMKSVENIGNEKVFSAEVVDTGDSPIMEHGFVWSGFQSPDIERDSVISLPSSEQLEIGDFSVVADYQFKINQTYYVRPFIKTNTNLIYGNVLFFVDQ